MLPNKPTGLWQVVDERIDPGAGWVVVFKRSYVKGSSDWVSYAIAKRIETSESTLTQSDWFGILTTLVPCIRNYDHYWAKYDKAKEQELFETIKAIYALRGG